MIGSEETLQKVKNEVAGLGEEIEQELEEVLQIRTVSIQDDRTWQRGISPSKRSTRRNATLSYIRPMSPQETMITISHSEHVERIPSKIVPTINPPHKKWGGLACGYFSITDPARSQLHCWSNVKMIAQAAGLCNQVWSPCLEVSGRDCELCHQVRQMQWSGMGLGGRMLHSSFHASGGCICGFELLSQLILSHGGAPISWTSGRQPFVASSTADRS